MFQKGDVTKVNCGSGELGGASRPSDVFQKVPRVQHNLKEILMQATYVIWKFFSNHILKIENKKVKFILIMYFI